MMADSPPYYFEMGVARVMAAFTRRDLAMFARILTLSSWIANSFRNQPRVLNLLLSQPIIYLSLLGRCGS